MSIPSNNDQALSELVASDCAMFGAGPSIEGTADAREFPRFPFRGRAKALVFGEQPSDEPQESEVITTDVSRNGLSLLHRRQLNPGQQILLVLSDTSRLVEVCWCCRVWAGLYSAGCRFVGVPAEKDVAS
jgi:hypothetical protein